MDYEICNSCAVVLENADDSHLEDERRKVVAEGVEKLGRVTFISADGNLDFYCDCCGAHTLGEVNFFASEW